MLKVSISPDPIPGGHAGIDARRNLARAFIPPPTSSCATVVGARNVDGRNEYMVRAVLRGDINRYYWPALQRSGQCRRLTSIRLT